MLGPLFELDLCRLGRCTLFSPSWMVPYSSLLNRLSRFAYSRRLCSSSCWLQVGALGRLLLCPERSLMRVTISGWGGFRDSAPNTTLLPSSLLLLYFVLLMGILQLLIALFGLFFYTSRNRSAGWGYIPLLVTILCYGIYRGPGDLFPYLCWLNTSGRWSSIAGIVWPCTFLWSLSLLTRWGNLLPLILRQWVMTRKLLELIWDSLRSQYSGNITNWMFLHSGAHVFLPGGSLSTVLHDVSSSDSDWCLAFTFLCDLKCSVIIRWASFNVLRALLAYLKDSYNTCCIRENWVYYVICRTCCICIWIVLSSTVLWNVLMFVLLLILFKYVLWYYI